MATPQDPALFLSHSGEQKGFVWSLYRELLHVNHCPFFDQDSRPDSLPKGSPFASRIVDACRACKLGIVVLSHEYIESMWPMLELQQLLFHNPSSPHNVFPIFYKLKPLDLCKPDNLMRWKRVWDRRAPVWHKRNRDRHMATPTTFQALTLDIDSWPQALEMLRHQNGQIRPENKDDHTFVHDIVLNICKRHPPPQPFHMDSYLKGAERIQQEIHLLFQQQQQRRDMTIGDAYRRRPISVGLYGVGGSGKTIVCNYMLNFYSKEYPGNCYFLQFSSKEDDERQLLVRSMKDILSKHDNLATNILETITSVQKAMPHVQEFLRQYKVFFILDNVWDWDLLVARQIMTMDYMPGSKLLVTARSENLLQTLLVDGALGGPPPMQIVHVPSISEEEATEALMAYSLTSSQYSSHGEDVQGLARSCFFGGQCHPLLLKAVGAKLRHLGGHIYSSQEWTQLCSRPKARIIHGGEEIEDTVVNVLKTSYDALHPRLQNTFLKLGTCVPKRYLHGIARSLFWSSMWLSMISYTASNSQTRDDIRDQIIELEYHGLLQIHKGDLVIHDLQMMLIQNIERKNNGEPGCFFFQGDVATLSASQWSRLKYIHGYVEKIGIPFDQRATSPNVSGIEVLHLEIARGYDRSLRLSVRHMRSLRHLVLYGTELEVVEGWQGAPNLVSVGLMRILSFESMSCLQRLECLKINFEDPSMVIRRSQNDCTIDGPLPACSSLQELSVTNDTELHKLSASDWINLRKLKLCNCERLQTIEGSGVCGFGTALEELSLAGCRSLESIPELKEAGNLRKLKLGGCEALKEVKVGDAVLTSLEHLSLDYGRCSFLLSAPSCSPLTIAAFTNLRSLHACGKGWGSTSGSEVVDVGSRNLPVSLEALELIGFRAAKEIVGLNTLVNLQCLRITKWPSLTRVTGLGALTKLTTLGIWACESLQEVGHWVDPFHTYKLKTVQMLSCLKLETLSTLRHLPSLTRFDIYRSPNVQEVMLPQGAHGYLNGKKIR